MLAALRFFRSVMLQKSFYWYLFIVVFSSEHVKMQRQQSKVDSKCFSYVCGCYLLNNDKCQHFTFNLTFTAKLELECLECCNPTSISSLKTWVIRATSKESFNEFFRILNNEKIYQILHYSKWQSLQSFSGQSDTFW